MEVDLEDQEVGMAFLWALPCFYEGLVTTFDALSRDSALSTLCLVKIRLLQVEQCKEQQQDDSKSDIALFNRMQETSEWSSYPYFTVPIVEVEAIALSAGGKRARHYDHLGVEKS